MPGTTKKHGEGELDQSRLTHLLGYASSRAAITMRKVFAQHFDPLELKVVEFEPEHLGKLQFYLEALDRDVKKPHEQPTIGVLLCATKNHEVVEYALSRAMSPALVAEYQTRMPDKQLLQAKLHEFYELAQEQAARPAIKEQTTVKPRKSRKK